MKKNEIAGKYDFSELSIDDGLRRLSEISDGMEEEDVSLEKSFELYEEGLALVKFLNEKVESVEAHVMKLSQDGTQTPFSEG